MRYNRENQLEPGQGGLGYYAQESEPQSAAMIVPSVIWEQELYDPISLGGKTEGDFEVE